MNVSKFNLLGEEINIKDEFLRDRITGLDISSLAVIGDSNAEGYGWWKGDISKKTNKNDGYCAVLRELYPNAVIDNYSVSGATLSVSGNYLLPQLENLLNSRKQYQHIIIQAGFNDIVSKINGTENFIGITPLSRNECFNKNSYENCIDSFCSYISKIKNALPESKIHFLMRESQYNDSSVHQLAYIHMHSELSVACQIMGVDFIDCSYNGINSTMKSTLDIYYYDGVHWNENAYRKIITPFIISHFIGNMFGSFSTVNKILCVNSISIDEIFNELTGITEGIQKFIDSLPTIYSFNGQLCLLPSRFTYIAEIVKNTDFFTAVIYRNNSNQKCIISSPNYKQVIKDGFFANPTSQPNLLTGAYTGYNYNESDITVLPAGTYGFSRTAKTPSGNVLKEYIDRGGTMIHSLINKNNGEVSDYWFNGGTIIQNIDLASNSHLKSGFYYVPSSNKENVLSSPPTNSGYGLIVCSHPFNLLGFMIAFNREGIWVADCSANWIKKV